MLVLCRKMDEDIVVLVDGTPVATIRVCEIRGDRVRLGFTAPPDIKFFRSELLAEETADPKPPAHQPAA